jgi:hypothetical protein
MRNKLLMALYQGVDADHKATPLHGRLRLVGSGSDRLAGERSGKLVLVQGTLCCIEAGHSGCVLLM